MPTHNGTKNLLYERIVMRNIFSGADTAPCLAIDIGASGGRHIAGWYENGTLRTEEIYRFANGTTEEKGHLVWNVAALLDQVLEGIRLSFARFGALSSLAIDTWGVDYMLLDKDGKELPPLYAYRDARTNAVIPSVHEILPFSELYRRTGIQFQPFNTIYQLVCDRDSGRLAKAEHFLMLPEYLSYKLTGVMKKEYTNATTTGLIHAADGTFDKEILQALSLPEKLFPALSQPGTEVGLLLPSIAERVGGQTRVLLCASHDTGAAVEGIELAEDSLYLSSGTWSLLGAKITKANCSEKSRLTNFTNEGGVGYIRYQKNIMGLWTVQSLKKELCPDKDFTVIAEEAAASSFSGIADINAPAFLSPPCMKEAFDAAFSETAARPLKPCDYFRCAFRSLAESYRVTIAELESNLGRSFSTLTIVGGGAKNRFLNALTEEVCQKKVVALPIEATALGNLKAQWIALQGAPSRN